MIGIGDDCLITFCYYDGIYFLLHIYTHLCLLWFYRCYILPLHCLHHTTVTLLVYVIYTLFPYIYALLTLHCGVCTRLTLPTVPHTHDYVVYLPYLHSGTVWLFYWWTLLAVGVVGCVDFMVRWDSAPLFLHPICDYYFAHRTCALRLHSITHAACVPDYTTRVDYLPFTHTFITYGLFCHRWHYVAPHTLPVTFRSVTFTTFAWYHAAVHVTRFGCRFTRCYRVRIPRFCRLRCVCVTRYGIRVTVGLVDLGGWRLDFAGAICARCHPRLYLNNCYALHALLLYTLVRCCWEVLIVAPATVHHIFHHHTGYTDPSLLIYTVVLHTVHYTHCYSVLFNWTGCTFTRTLRCTPALHRSHLFTPARCCLHTFTAFTPRLLRSGFTFTLLYLPLPLLGTGGAFVTLPLPTHTPCTFAFVAVDSSRTYTTRPLGYSYVGWFTLPFWWPRCALRCDVDSLHDWWFVGAHSTLLIFALLITGDVGDTRCYDTPHHVVTHGDWWLTRRCTLAPTLILTIGTLMTLVRLLHCHGTRIDYIGGVYSRYWLPVTRYPTYHTLLTPFYLHDSHTLHNSTVILDVRCPTLHFLTTFTLHTLPVPRYLHTCYGGCGLFVVYGPVHGWFLGLLPTHTHIYLRITPLCHVLLMPVVTCSSPPPPYGYSCGLPALLHPTHTTFLRCTRSRLPVDCCCYGFAHFSFTHGTHCFAAVRTCCWLDTLPPHTALHFTATGWCRLPHTFPLLYVTALLLHTHTIHLTFYTFTCCSDFATRAFVGCLRLYGYSGSAVTLPPITHTPHLLCTLLIIIRWTGWLFFPRLHVPIYTHFMPYVTHPFWTLAPFNSSLHTVLHTIACSVDYPWFWPHPTHTHPHTLPPPLVPVHCYIYHCTPLLPCCWFDLLFRLIVDFTVTHYTFVICLFYTPCLALPSQFTVVGRYPHVRYAIATFLPHTFSHVVIDCGVTLLIRCCSVDVVVTGYSRLHVGWLPPRRYHTARTHLHTFCDWLLFGVVVIGSITFIYYCWFPTGDD